MAKIKFYKAAIFLTLLVTGCGGGGNSGSDNTEKKTVKQMFEELGYKEARSWPSSTIREFYTEQDFSTAWTTKNILPVVLPRNTVFFFFFAEVENEEFITYKNLDYAIPTTEKVIAEEIISTYYTALVGTDFSLEYNEETLTIHAFIEDDDSAEIQVSVSKATISLPEHIIIRFIVREKLEFPEAPNIPKGSISWALMFNNIYEITDRDQDRVVWKKIDLDFIVEKAESEYYVGNLPNNGGLGYLSSPLRIYEKQKVTISIPYNITRIIIRTDTSTSNPYSSLETLPVINDENITTYISTSSILYSFSETSEMKQFSFIAAGPIWLNGVVVYSLGK